MKAKSEMGIHGCITADYLFKTETLRHLMLTVYYGKGFITNDDKNIEFNGKEIALTANQKDILKKMGEVIKDFLSSQAIKR